MAVEPKFLFETIVARWHHVALRFGALVISVAAYAANKRQSSPRLLRALLTDDTRPLLAALRLRAQAGVSEETGRKLEQLCHAIVAARRRLAPFAEPVEHSRAQARRIARPLPALRETARAIAQAFALLEAQTRAALTPSYLSDAQMLQKFLERAAQGDLSDIDAFGAVTPPRLNQRRLSPRMALKIPCRVLSMGWETSATIVDVSREGLGLRCEAEIAEQEKVTLILPPQGRRLQARVIWRRDGIVGVALEKPLSLSDPLYLAAKPG